MKAKLAARIRAYFKGELVRCTGLCTWVECSPNYDFKILLLFKEYAINWPHAVKKEYMGEMILCPYVIPASLTDKSQESAAYAYRMDGDMKLNPLRLDLANFIVKQIAREQKVKFVPISFDNSPPIE